MRRANYAIVGELRDLRGDPFVPDALVIRDIGPWETFQSVTNAAEEVVEELVKAGKLPNGRRLLYYDSDNQLDEIVMENGQFKGFAFPKDIS
jgi:hypothetical protein